MRSLLLKLGLAFLIAGGVAYAQDARLLPFVPAGDETPATILDGYLLGGDPSVWPCAPDLFFRSRDFGGDERTGHCLDDGTPKLYARSLVLADKGDAIDLAIRRAGPDNGGKTGTPATVGAGANLGTIYWQAWGPNDDRPEGYWKAGKGKNGRVAAVYARADGNQTKNSRPGKLCIATTPSGQGGDPIDRLCVDNKGTPLLFFNGKLVPVTVKDKDTCGKGFRCLRVPN